MELEHFITADHSAAVTGIKNGDWFVARRLYYPWRIFQCDEVIGHEGTVVRAVEADPQNWEMFSTSNCFLLDKDYPIEQIKELQKRAREEFDTFARSHLI